MSGNSKVGIFGGTFNPPHISHVRAAEAFLRQMSLDRLLIVPSCTSPHKKDAVIASALDRYKMCELAFSELEKTEISDIEIKRGGRSYTCDTLAALNGESLELYFLCGTDAFLSLDKWKNPQDIFNLASICVIERERASRANELNDKISEYKSKFNARIFTLNTVPTTLSSTFVRECLATNRDTFEYVPKSVIEFIEERGLYK